MAINRLSYLLGTELTGFHYSGRSETERSQLAAEIPATLHDAVLDFSDATRVSVSEIMEDALRRYLRQHHWNEEVE